MKNNNLDMTWYKDSRFGMFIHWGLYAILGGIWKGERYPNEWIMNRANIPVLEYEKLASQFNPMNFDAKFIVDLAVEAGMKYLVFTSKHHDGFAMYKSKASKYNIVDATPFKRDVVLELANECAKKNIKFGVYYSQAQDWHHPNGAGNFWDWPDEEAKDFQKYLDDKVYPQMEELLTNYGEISIVWFDTPVKINTNQAQDLLAYVRHKQPQCIVNSRLGSGGGLEWGDFISLRDNEVPTLPLDEYAETCATLNGGWGYSKYDQKWKEPKKIISLLSDVVAKNANYLLNIGPDPLGNVPNRSVNILKEVGKWLRINGESIYYTNHSPFNMNFNWGAVTQKENKIYCHLSNFNDSVFKIQGIKSKIDRAYYLDDSKNKLDVLQEMTGKNNDVTLTTVKNLADSEDNYHRVLCLEVNSGEIMDFDNRIIEQPDDVIILESLLAYDNDIKKSIAKDIMNRGSVANSLKENITLVWDFEVLKEGCYKISAECGTGRYHDYSGTKHIVDEGHEIEVLFENKIIKAIIKEESRKDTRGNPHWPYIISSVGDISILKPGNYSIKLKVNKVVLGKGGGFILKRLKLELV